MSTTLVLITTTAAAVPTGYLAGLLTATHRLRGLKARLAEAEWRAAHDPLTGLPNRAYAAALFTTRAAAQQPTLVVLLDLDRFKQVNDRHGHDAGDQLLTTIAARLTTVAEHAGGHAARLAGDEFLLLLPIEHGDPLSNVANALTTLAAPTRIGATRLSPKATAGVAIFDGIEGTWPQLVRRADIALYHARAHRHPYELHHPGMDMPPPPRPRRRHLRDQHETDTPQ